MFGFVGGMTAKQGREPILILGFVTAAVAYFLMLLNLPAASAIRETLPGETGLMTPNSIIVLVTGFGLGFSDACFMTQVSQTYIIKVKEQHAFRHTPFLLDRLETTRRLHLEYSNFFNPWPSLLQQSMAHI